MTLSWRPASSHLLLLAGLGCLVLYINARGSERYLRGLDRDLFSLIRADHPDQLRNLDLTHGLWPKLHLSAMNLAGEDLRGLRMSGNRLTDLDLRGSHLEQAEFQCVSMNNVNLSGANLKEARFDYVNCPGNDTKVLGIDLNGADLSAAELDGRVFLPGNQEKSCKTKLKIKGNLNGAKFTGATFQCVTLINTSSHENKVHIPEHSSFDPPYTGSLPLYAGINFSQSKLNALTLASGDFRFSDFYQANLQQLRFNPPLASLSFSSLAYLQCPDEQPCMLTQVNDQDQEKASIPGAKVLDGLSINLRDSRIRSNLSLPSVTPSVTPSAASGRWPALLCNKNTIWISSIRPDLQFECWPLNQSGNVERTKERDRGFLFKK